MYVRGFLLKTKDLSPAGPQIGVPAGLTRDKLGLIILYLQPTEDLL